MSGKKQFHPLNMLSIQQISTIYKLLTSFATKNNISLESVFKYIYKLAISQPAEIHPSQKIEEAATINHGGDLSASTQDNDRITSKPLSSAFKKSKENDGHIKKTISFDFTKNKYSDNEKVRVAESLYLNNPPEELNKETKKELDIPPGHEIDPIDRTNTLMNEGGRIATTDGANRLFYRKIFKKYQSDAEKDFLKNISNYSFSKENAVKDFEKSMEISKEILPKLHAAASNAYAKNNNKEAYFQAFSDANAILKSFKKDALSELSNTVNEDYRIRLEEDRFTLKKAIKTFSSDHNKHLDTALAQSKARSKARDLGKKPSYKKHPNGNESEMTESQLIDAATAEQVWIEYWENNNKDQLDSKNSGHIFDAIPQEEHSIQAQSMASPETEIKTEPELETSKTGWIAPIEPTQGDEQEPNSNPQDIDASTEPPVMDSSPGNDSVEPQDDAAASSDSSFTDGERPPSPENQQPIEISAGNDGNPLPENQDTHSSNGPVPNTGSNSAPGSQTIDRDEWPGMDEALIASRKSEPSKKLAPEITITTSTTDPLPPYIPFFSPYPDDEDTQPRQSDESIEDARPVVPSSPWDDPIDQQNDITVTPGPIHSAEESLPSPENQQQPEIPLENDGNPLPANQETHSSNFLALNAGSDSSPPRNTHQREYFTTALENIYICHELLWLKAGHFGSDTTLNRIFGEIFSNYPTKTIGTDYSLGYLKNTELPKPRENIDDATATKDFSTQDEPIDQENSIKETYNSQEIQKKNIESIAPEIEPETTNATDSIEAEVEVEVEVEVEGEVAVAVEVEGEVVVAVAVAVAVEGEGEGAVEVEVEVEVEGEGEGEGEKDTQPIDTNVVIDTGLQVINYSPLTDSIDRQNDITVTLGPIHSAEESLRLAENLPPAGPSSEDSGHALQDNQNTYYFIPSAAMPGGVTEKDGSNDQQAGDTADALECALSDVSSPMDSPVDQLAPANLATTTTPPIVDTIPWESLDLGGTIPTSSAAPTDSDLESASYTIPLFIAGAGAGALLYAWQRGLLSAYIADELLGDIVACIIGYDYFA